MRGTVILTNFEFSSTIIGKVSHLSGGFSGAPRAKRNEQSTRGRKLVKRRCDCDPRQICAQHTCTSNARITSASNIFY